MLALRATFLERANISLMTPHAENEIPRSMENGVTLHFILGYLRSITEEVPFATRIAKRKRVGTQNGNMPHLFTFKAFDS